MSKITRRLFFKLAGAAATVSAAPAALSQPAAQPAHKGSAAAKAGADKPVYSFFQQQEAAWIEAAVARLIPNDELGAGAVEAGVPQFIDKQMAGAWGAGERLYRSGPWQAGTPQQGYQLPFTPAELFRNALRGIAKDLQQSGHASFAKMSADQQDAYLKQLQEGQKDFEGVPGKTFFESLWSLTLEGYFSDPVYGGNIDMASWRMIGFPGAYANYYQLVDQHNISFDQAPISLADNGHGIVRIYPGIPASVHQKGK